MERSFRRTKYSCYMANITQAVVCSLSPVLFLTFRGLYGISYALLGTLVLVNFCTQLGVDLLFSFFSHKFNISRTAKSMPILAVLGLALFALAPVVFPNAVFVGLLLGTVVFSASSGLAEVLVSPIVAAIPAENPEREMSKLHAAYAWGAVGTVVVATLFLFAFGGESWQWLVLVAIGIPLVGAVLFISADLPPMQRPERTSGALGVFKNAGLWLCFVAIFLGGASEVIMGQWSSSYLESALGLPKIWGDLCGVALFGLTLALGRTLYAKIGKNIGKVLFLGAIGASACYLIAVFVNVPVVGLLACGLTGFCVSMLWPGTLVAASERFPTGGVVVFSLMAAGGDLGAAAGSQLVGVVADFVAGNAYFSNMASTLGLTGEQLAMRAGLLVGALFPILAIAAFFVIRRLRAKKPAWTGKALSNDETVGKTYLVSAAGRVNLIGEHVDYCGGRVLPAALALKNRVTVRKNGENVLRLTWTTLPDTVTLDIDKLSEYKGEKYAKYQAACAYVWQRLGHKIVGCDMHFDCHVPFGSGLSSSAAIEVSTIAALCVAAEEKIDPKEIAIAAQKAENEYVGVRCGIMDQYVSACGKKNHALLLDCKRVEGEYIPVDFGKYQLVIANCNKPHGLVGSEYNRRRQETEEALAILQKALDVSCLADVREEAFEGVKETLPELLRKRAYHVVSECERVRKAAEAMRSGDMIALGKLLNESHQSLKDNYEVTGKELDELAWAAQAHPACVGSRMTGGGFGGCTVSLVEKDKVEDFKAYVAERYEQATGYPVTFYETDIGDGLTVEEV